MANSTITGTSFLKVTIAAAVTGCLAIAGGVWWIRDEMDRRFERQAERYEARLTERLGGYVSREQRYEDKIELLNRLDRIIKLAETKRR